MAHLGRARTTRRIRHLQTTDEGARGKGKQAQPVLSLRLPPRSSHLAVLIQRAGFDQRDLSGR